MGAQSEGKTLDAYLDDAAQRVALLALGVDQGLDLVVLFGVETVDFARIAQRRPDASWKAVYEPVSGGNGLFDAWPMGNQDILFVGSPPHTRLLLSGTTFTRLPDPIDFTAFGVWALDANTHWLAGQRTTTGSSAFVIKATR